MPASFDFGRPQIWFSSKFWKNHVWEASPGDNQDKKRAEEVFLRRSVQISTVLCLTRIELVRLAGEIHSRHSEFADHPNREFQTRHPYNFWSRGGPTAGERQRATPGSGSFLYKVLIDQYGNYVMDHFAGTR